MRASRRVGGVREALAVSDQGITNASGVDHAL
jgi:hypothetical protein